jgi:ABC-type bacteriocin/lantibiotic exporter with double-glycine peptidase domain
LGCQLSGTSQAGHCHACRLTYAEMPILEIPYRRQLEEASCGIAAFEMVYKYFRPSKQSVFNQSKVFHRLRTPTPDGANTRITSESIVQLAKERKFFADWGRVSPDIIKMNKQINFFIKKKLPLIACQQWHKDRSLGHFRVIAGIEDDQIVFHDPEVGTGGSRLPYLNFIREWRPTEGGNVTGGVAIWISKEPLRETPLGSDFPNPWV